MRLVLVSSLAAIAAVTTPACADVTMVRAADFVASIGVASHVAYTDGNYANLSNVESGLQYLGVRYLRDSAPANDQQSQRFSTLAQAGYRFTLMVNGSLSTQLSRSSALFHAYPSSVTAIEGPNEVNNQPVSYGGMIGTGGAQAYQQALYASVKTDSYLKSVPVLNFTDYPDETGRADAGTFHSYPKAATDPDPTLWYDAKNQAAVMPSLPLWCTESGFYTMKGADGVSEAVQASYLIETLAYNATRGISKTYLYELVDQKADSSTPTNTEMHYGLFRSGFVPKASATQLHNLITFAQDNGSSSSSFTPSPFFVSFSNPKVKNIALAKSDGSYLVLFWIEGAVWNSKTQSAITPTATHFTFTFPASRTVTSLHIADGTTKAIGRGANWGWDYTSGVAAVSISAK